MERAQRRVAIGLLLNVAVFEACTGVTDLANALLEIHITPSAVELEIGGPMSTCAQGGQLEVELAYSRDLHADANILVTFEGLPNGVGLVRCAPRGEEELVDPARGAWSNSNRTDPPTSTWRFTVAAGASSSEHTVTVRAETRHDGVTKSHVSAFTLGIRPDLVAPTVEILTPPTPGAVGVPVVTVTGTASDNVAVASLGFTLNAGAEQAVALSAPVTNWSFDVAGLSPGPNTVDVLARDAAGNVGSASAVVEYLAPTSPVVCNEPLDGSLSLGEQVRYDLPVPPGDRAFALRLESVDLDGSYEYLQDDVLQFGGPAAAGFVLDRFELRGPGVRYALVVRADNAAGALRVQLQCERSIDLGEEVSVTQVGGLAQLYRFTAAAGPIRAGVHRPQVLNGLRGDVWSDANTVNLDPAGNPAGGYHTEFLPEALAAGGSHTVIWQSWGFAPDDVEEYAFAISGVDGPAPLTLDVSGSATVNADVGHLGQLRFYGFAGLAGESYTVTVDHPTGSLAAEVVVERSGGSPWPFYQSPHTPLAQGWTTRDPAERSVTGGPFVLPADGLYTIRVGANGRTAYDATRAETIGGFRLVLERQ